VRARAWGLIFLGICLLAMAVLLSWAVLFGIAVGLVALPLFVLASTRSPRRGEWSDVTVPRQCERLETTSVQMELRLGAPRLWVGAYGPSDATGDTTMCWVPDGTELAWPVTSDRRGEFPIGPVALAFADPFGFRARTLAERMPTQLLVTPRIAPAPTWVSRQVMDDVLDEASMGSEHFHSLREYVVGDPLKRIHWKSSAKTGTLMVRHMVDAVNPTLLLILDCDQSSYRRSGSLFADFDATLFEEAVDLWASWVVSNANTGQRILATTTGSGATLMPVEGRRTSSALRWMAFIDSKPGTGGSLTARIAPIIARSRAQRVVLVTGPSQGSTHVQTNVGRAQVRLVRAA
jgi:uncharacterized protein (DUF58 family)